MVSYRQMKTLMNQVFEECNALREAGQKEYAQSESDALANFKRVAELTGQTQEQVLFTYMYKHVDGVASYIKGHRSQRESVKGRINDLIVYACLLRAMVEEKETVTTPVD